MYSQTDNDKRIIYISSKPTQCRVNQSKTKMWIITEIWKSDMEFTLKMKRCYSTATPLSTLSLLLASICWSINPSFSSGTGHFASNIKLVSARCSKIGMMSWSHTHENIHLLWLSGICTYFGETLFSSKSTRAWYIWANLWSSALASLIKLFFSFGNIYLFGERSGNTNVKGKLRKTQNSYWLLLPMCVCVCVYFLFLCVLTFQSMSITGYCHLYSLMVLHVQNS